MLTIPSILRIGHDHHVPDALLGHDVEDVGNAIGRSARWWRRLHDVFRREANDLRAMLGKCANEQAIRYDADWPVAAFHDDDGRNASIHEKAAECRRRDRERPH